MTAQETTSGFSRFVAEMRRRHVVRFALGYAAAAFVVLQLAEIVFPAFGIGEGGLRVLVVLTGLAFLPALVLAWVYDITTEGIKRTEAGDNAAGPSRLALSALLITTVVVTGGLGLYLVDQGVLTPAPASTLGTQGPVLAAAYDPSEPIRSLAVLPLQDFSPSGDQAYFTSGMHEELIAKLSLIEDVRVVSRTTVNRYADPDTRPASPQIGFELGVDAFIEGSVTRSDRVVRVTLQIIHAASDSHIETLQWERNDLEDVLAFQTEIAHGVVDAIVGDHDHDAFQSTTVASADPQAQDAFLRARHEYDRGTADGYRMALEYFEEAIEEDPEFAAAMAGAASARFLLGLENPETSVEAIAQAHREAEQALAMDRGSMEAMEVLSAIERSMPVVGKEIVVDRPLGGGGPNVITAPGTFDSITVDVGFDDEWVTAVTGLGERIDEQLRRRGLLDRGDQGVRQAAEARRLYSRGRYTDAANVLEVVVRESPQMAPAWDLLARSKAASGDIRGAREAIVAWHESGAPNAPDEDWIDELDDAIEDDGVDGYWEWQLDRLEWEYDEGRPVSRIDLAAASAALGDHDDAFDYLYEALEAREPGLLTLRSDPIWDDLRRDDRFRELSRRAQAMRFDPPRGARRGPGR